MSGALDPDSDELRVRIAAILRELFAGYVEEMPPPPSEGFWLGQAEDVLAVIQRYEDQAQRTRPRQSAAQCGSPVL